MRILSLNNKRIRGDESHRQHVMKNKNELDCEEKEATEAVIVPIVQPVRRRY